MRLSIISIAPGTTPAETWSMSTPASSSQRQTWSDSASVLPGRNHGSSSRIRSRGEILKPRKKSSPTSARIARTTSSEKRARFSSDPP